MACPRSREAPFNGIQATMSWRFMWHRRSSRRTAAWDNLKRELCGVYADSVWEHLAGTTSEPFVAGEHKQIAVKVIDDRGNELLVVKKLSEAQSE